MGVYEISVLGCGIIYHMTKERLVKADHNELIQQIKSDISKLRASIASVDPLL